ncbi:SCO family protein [Flavobacterium sp.]|uniref:SCO family protein n=1 Tax=Flavobacterium sp. TaxID=239 RepID=UPI0026257757|nr:SCO family protein [Flavobacterium sp.]MDD3005131.1 SCO family protein [Flavobacterium sp.]
MKKLILLSLSFVLLFGCQSSAKKEKEQTENKPITELSIYNLPEKWTTQEGNDIELKQLRGKVLVMVMIYTSCKAACPRLVADMRNIEKRVPKEYKDKVQYVLFSIDPKVDTPERLKTFSIENKMDSEQWLFLRSNDEQTREFSAVLAVNYKKISPIDFSHSNIISVFNAEGELTFQQEGLGADYDKTVSKIKEEAQKIK